MLLVAVRAASQAMCGTCLDGQHPAIVGRPLPRVLHETCQCHRSRARPSLASRRSSYARQSWSSLSLPSLASPSLGIESLVGALPLDRADSPSQWTYGSWCSLIRADSTPGRTCSSAQRSPTVLCGPVAVLALDWPDQVIKMHQNPCDQWPAYATIICAETIQLLPPASSVLLRGLGDRLGGPLAGSRVGGPVHACWDQSVSRCQTIY